MRTMPKSTQTKQPFIGSRGRLFNWFKRGLLGLLIALIVLAASGAIYQAAATARDRRAFAMPGQLVEVDAHRMHIYCVGPTRAGITDKDNPTVILEAGLGAPSSVWAWIQPGIAQMARVCAYDRAGLGWSEPSASARDAQHIADELHTLLQNARVAGPYVLVGWSFGGLYVRTYAGRYPTEVAGIVLLDSSSPDQCTSTPTGEAQCRNTGRIYRIAPALARLGVMRLMGHFQPPSGLPEPQNAELMASTATTQDWDTQSAEFLASAATNAQARAATLPLGVPLLVVTATDHGTPPDLEELWQVGQRQMAVLSTNSAQRVIEGASHASLVYDAQDAQASLDAILQVIVAARRGDPLASLGN